MGTGMAQADMHKENGGIGSMKTGTIHVETGPVGRTLFLFAVPVIISQVLQEFYNIVDCAIVGHFAGGTALAAAGVSGLILSVLVNFFIGFSSGVSVITSRLFGEYAYAKLKTMISGVVKLVLAVGIMAIAWLPSTAVAGEDGVSAAFQASSDTSKGKNH